MLLIEKKGKKYFLRSEEINIENLSYIKASLAKKILFSLAKKEKSIKELATELNKPLQNIYYHVNKLKSINLIEIKNVESVKGFNKYIYGLKSPSFHFIIKKEKEKSSLQIPEKNFLLPFIEEGRINCKIIIGSPHMHGVEKARSTDAFFISDLLLFFGSFLNRIEKNVCLLDTEVKERDLKDNLIVIGGPIVNTITAKLNDKLLVSFLKREKSFFSKLTNKKYFDDEIGVIIKQKNPFNKNKHVLVIEGKRYFGTKACVICFLNYFEELNKRINEKNYVIVRGYDEDSDGIIDNVEFLE